MAKKDNPLHRLRHRNNALFEISSTGYGLESGTIRESNKDRNHSTTNSNER